MSTTQEIYARKLVSRLERDSALVVNDVGGGNTQLPTSLGTGAPNESLAVTEAYAGSPTRSNIASSTLSTLLLAANNARKTAVIVNDSTSNLYVVFGGVASTTNFTLFLSAKVDGVPAFATFKGSDYSGEVSGIWSSSNGFARVTEVV